MVIVFATVVFTGSVIKGARDRVGGLFGKPRSIKSEQESRRNKSVTSTEPNDTTKTPSCRQTLPHHISNTPNNSTTTKARCFQSYSSDDFFNCPEEHLTVKAQGNAEKQVQEPKKDTGATTASETVETDHAMIETSRIRDGQSGLGMREDQEKIEMNIKNDGKPKRVSFQTSPSQKGQVRHRREPPKTLKKELEEEGMFIDEAGEARIATKPCKQLEERSSQDQSNEVSTEEQIENLKQIRIIEEQQGETSSHNQCDEVKTKVPLDNLKEDEANEIDPAVSEITSAVPDPGNLHSSQDDSSVTKDGQNSIKLHDAEESNDAIECCTDEKVVPTQDTTVFKPAMMDQNLEEDKSLLSKQHNTGEAKEHGRKNILHVSKEEKDTSCNNNSNDIYNTDSDKVKIPQEDVEHACSHVSRPPNGSHLSESKQVDAPSFNAGYTAQNQSENENQPTKDTISENGNFEKSAVIEQEKVPVRNVGFGDTARIKHRSQKGTEGSSFWHRNTQQENDATRRVNAKVVVGTTKISEGNSQESKGSSEDQPQPSTVQQIPTVTNSDGKEAVVNYSAAQTSFEHSRDLHTLNILLPPLTLTVDLPDEWDHVFDRCRSGNGRLDTTQNCVELSAEPRSQYYKEIPSDKSDDNEPIEQSQGSISDKYLDNCYSTEPFFCTRKKDEEVSHRIRSCSHASDRQESNVKNILHRFLEDFGAVDCVGAYWSPDNPRGKNSDIIVMALEKRDQKGKRMEKCELQERIIKVTEKLTAITREIERQEDRLLKLEKEVRTARSESEKSEQELQKEQSLYRESLLRCCKVKEDAMTLESRCRAIELELRTMKQRRERTNYMLKNARGEVRLLDHQIAKEQTLQEEQRDKRLGDKRRRFRWTSLKINTLAALIVLQIILIIIVALWRL